MLPQCVGVRGFINNYACIISSWKSMKKKNDCVCFWVSFTMVFCKKIRMGYHSELCNWVSLSMDNYEKAHLVNKNITKYRPSFN